MNEIAIVNVPKYITDLEVSLKRLFIIVNHFIVNINLLLSNNLLLSYSIPILH